VGRDKGERREVRGIEGREGRGGEVGRHVRGEDRMWGCEDEGGGGSLEG